MKKQRQKISGRKLKIAQRAARLLGKIPTVKMVAVTGALAMNNAKEESDIDLMIITKTNLLWLTRLVILVILVILHIPFRRAGRRDEKDKLCINLWLDEIALVWDKKDRNIYTAHEIAQIVPLVNKDFTYERFLAKNKWILDYWPNAVHIESTFKNSYAKTHALFVNVVEQLAFKLQCLYMKPKITREVVTLHKAIFHPRNWGKEINELLSA